MKNDKKQLDLNKKNKLSKADNKKFADAKVLIDKRNYQKAIELLGVLIECNPDVAEVYYYLGVCYSNESKNIEAATCLKKAIEYQPGDAKYYSMLGVSYAKVGSINLAKDAYLKAIDLDAGCVSAYVGLGDVFYNQENFESAKKNYLNAVKKKPSMSAIQLRLGFLFSNEGDYVNARKYAEKAVRQTPADSNIMGVVGRIYLVGGDIDKAVQHFYRAIKLDNTNGYAYYDLVSTKKIKDKDDKIISEIERNLLKSMPAQNRQVMHFSLGQAYNDSKQWDKAFAHFIKGNRLIPTSYNQKEELKFYSSLKNIFTATFFEKFINIEPSSMFPIFIVGMPRSGSTLIDQVLSSHSNVFSMGESKALSDVTNVIVKKTNYTVYPLYMKKVDSATLKTLTEQYLKVIRKHGGGIPYVVNKMLFNFIYLGLIAILFPNAKIIHSVRNPLDTSLSCLFNSFISNGTEKEWSSSLENIGFMYKQYFKLMEYWKKVLPVKMLDIQYENMVADLETNARNIINYCDLEWEPQCLEFYKSKRSVQTASVSQVRQPIYNNSVSRWPSYAKHLGPLVEQLGDIAKDDYEQLRELGCKFKIKKGLLGKLFH